MMLAPIIVFAYRRSEHLRKTLTSLIQCDGFNNSKVIIYVDGPKKLDDILEVDATKQVAMEMLGSSAEYHFSEFNKGLSRSIIEGVTEVLQRYEKAIILEDDLLLAPNFISYMNATLDRYQFEENVFQISGYMFDVPEFAKRKFGMFYPLTVSWGWATWKRAWSKFDVSASGWENLLSNKFLRRKFDIDNSYGYSNMLIRQMMGKIDSWAVRWYWTAFKYNALTFFPPQTLHQC